MAQMATTPAAALLLISALGSGMAQAALPSQHGRIYTNAPKASRNASASAARAEARPIAAASALGARRLAAPNVITSEQKQAVLKKHNDLRGAVTQPCTAADMETLVWDDALEAAAAAWGQQCIWEHDDANQANGWGENLAFERSSSGNFFDTSTLTTFVQWWYDEVVDTEWTTENIVSKSYSDPPNECQVHDKDNPSECMVGHYTQVVWAKSNRIGCSVHQCSDGLIGNQGGVVLVCKYTPGGNLGSVFGGLQLPFILGAPCAYCHETCTNNMCPANTQVNRCEDAISVVTVNGVPFYACENLIRVVDGYCQLHEDAGNEVCRYSCGGCGRPVDLGLDYCGATATGELEWSDLDAAPPGAGRLSAAAALAALAAGLLGVRHSTC